MNWIRKIDLKVAAYLNVVAIMIAIIVHLLVIFQIMPFSWINGGRSETLAIAQRISIISIVVLTVMILINLWACALLPVEKYVKILKIVLWILFAYSIFGVLQQLLGTPFERFCMSTLCIINVVMYFRLVIEKRKQIV